ncbi:protein translocase subunit SecD [Kangiella sediminilitoris]|uniref:Protein translocase subunit SecD n=1 Tax=Kangiella sediminilitoris TaxID=1144748 RepID=A0A1B3BB29_9GAMM|nr:protein translocase subunit SecD [Kangiella sediminilitoris]AOE49998.1 Protein translocase subunit SecD [Kangiella sediminilitoris]
MFVNQPNQQQLPINTYPKWKYVLIVFVLALAFLYAAPNIFGEDPAVQLSGLRDTTISQAQLDQIEQGWEEKGLNPISVTPSSIGAEGVQKVIARFSKPADQLKAREVANDVLNPTLENQDYVTALNLAPATPDWLAGIGGSPMKLGLDLRGGIHFLMQVDMEEALKRQQDQLRRDFIDTLTNQDPSIRGRVEPIENGMLLSFRNEEDAERAYAALFQEHSNRIELSLEEKGGRPVIRGTLNKQKLQEIRDNAIEQNRLILSNRVNSLGVAEPLIQRQGADRIVVQLPGVQDSALAKQILGATATLEFRLVNHEGDVTAARNGRVPPDSKLFESEYGPILVFNEVEVSGEHLTNATATYDSQTNEPIVSVRLDSEGGSKMTRTTTENVNNQLAMILKESRPIFDIKDGKRVLVDSKLEERLISAPNINGPFGSRFQITGRFTEAETRDLATKLRSGALIAPTFIVEERTIGATLGEENIEKGVMSVIIGFALVLAFMLLYYKLFGVVANIALTLNLVLIVCVMSLMGATLTLPGIAGIVLTVGMAVDANVLIFERIREELRAGVRPAQAIDKGYAQALSTIADANITTAIAAIILFAIGTGPVKGFAITLFIGILTSMFTAIFVSRGIVNLMYGGRTVKKLSI